MFIAKLRLSALPITIETGKFERPRLPPNERLCAICRVPNGVEKLCTCFDVKENVRITAESVIDCVDLRSRLI